LELNHIIAKLSDKSNRIITITGASGVGKTRLAIEISKTIGKDKLNVLFIPLEAITDADRVPTEIAPAVGFAQIKTPNQLIDYFQSLRKGHYLLVIDNFEHVMRAKTFIEELSFNCPGLQFLITSRKKLDLKSELEVHLLPLPVPPPKDPRLKTASPAELLASFPSVKLFVELASGKGNFVFSPNTARDVAELCIRTQGLPLAIETIASHLEAKTPGQILASIRSSGFLTYDQGQRDGAERHDSVELFKTIQDTIGWNYSLLTEEGKKFFRFIAVFEGGFTLNTAQAFFNRAGQQGLNIAVNIELLLLKGLLKQENQQQFDNQSRYKMLEIVRLYALDQLRINGEMYKAREYHAKHFIVYAEEAEPKLNSWEREHGRWLDRLSLEYENFRAVLEWSLENPEMHEFGLRLAGSLFWFWNLQGHLSEGRKWLDDLLEVTTHLGRLEARAKALYGAGGLAFLQSDYLLAYDKLKASEEIWRELDEKIHPGAKRRLGYALIILGMVEYNRGKLAQAVSFLGESKDIFTNEVTDEWGKALSLNDWGRVETTQGDYTGAEETFQKSLSLWNSMNDNWGRSLTLNCLGVVARRNKEYRKASERLLEALTRQKNNDKWGMALTYKDLAAVYCESGHQTAGGNYRKAKKEYRHALYYYDTSLHLHEELGRKQLIAECFEGLSKIAVDLKNWKEGCILLGAAEKIRLETHARLSGMEAADHHHYTEELKLRDQSMYEKQFACGIAMSTEEVLKRAHANINNWTARLRGQPY
jgi:predicted ATPase